MRSMIRALVARSSSRTFLRFLVLILAAEAVTIGVAWFMLDINTSAWIREQTARLVPISQQAASSADWSRLGEILDDKNSSLRESYSRQLTKLSRPFFGNEGAVYVVVVDHGHAWKSTAATLNQRTWVSHLRGSLRPTQHEKRRTLPFHTAT